MVSGSVRRSEVRRPGVGVGSSVEFINTKSLKDVLQGDPVRSLKPTRV